MDNKYKKRNGVATIAEWRADRSGALCIWLFACCLVLTNGCGDASKPVNDPYTDTTGLGASADSGLSASGGVGGAVSGGVGGTSGFGGTGGVDVVASGGSAAGAGGSVVLDAGSSPPVDASIIPTVDTSIPTVIDSGAADGASLSGGSGGSTPVGGSGGTDTGVPGTGGSGGGATDLNCPDGFNSELPLVLTGDTVPGNLELGLATAPETPRNPCGTPEEQICFNLINAEREKVGKAPFIWDGDLADLGRSHAADRNQQFYPGSQHGSSTNTNHLYQERAQFLGLKSGKFMGVVENACMGAFGGQGAFNCWLSSPGHTDVMLGNGTWAMLKYAACGGDGTQWNLELGY
jgi:hypothetical protein